MSQPARISKEESVTKIRAMRSEVDTLKNSMNQLQDELQKQTAAHNQEVQTMLASIVQAFASVNANTVAQAEREAVQMREKLEDLELAEEQARAELQWDCPQCNYPNLDGVTCAHCGFLRPGSECSGAEAFATIMEADMGEEESEDEHEKSEQTEHDAALREVQDPMTCGSNEFLELSEQQNALFEGNNALFEGNNALFESRPPKPTEPSRGCQLPRDVIQQHEIHRSTVTQLMQAVEDANLACVEQALAEAADPADEALKVDNHGCNVLHYAARCLEDCNGRENISEILNILLGALGDDQKRAALDATSQTRDTPLHVAARKANVHAARCLVEAGSNVLCGEKTEETPLHVMATELTACCSEDLVHALVANVNPAQIQAVVCSVLHRLEKSAESLCASFDPAGDKTFRGASGRLREYEGLMAALNAMEQLLED